MRMYVAAILVLVMGVGVLVEWNYHAFSHCTCTKLTGGSGSD